MVAREASLLPDTALQAGVDAADVTTKWASLVGKYVCLSSNHCKIRRGGGRLPVPMRELFHRIVGDCYRIRFSFAWTRVYNSA
jgi:hypothetical protein